MPGWSERIKLMGWRNLYFAPAALLLLSLVFWPWWGAILWQFVLGWWQLGALVVILPLAAARHAARHALRLRKDPFCIHCGYSLTGLPDGHNCPECGGRFDLKVIEEYRRDPHWFIVRFQQRHQLPPPHGGIVAGNSPRKSTDGT